MGKLEVGEGRLPPCSSYRPSWTPLSCALQWQASGAFDEAAQRRLGVPSGCVGWLSDCWLQRKAEKPAIGR